MARFLWICLGGAAGTGARYLLAGWLLRMRGPASLGDAGGQRPGVVPAGALMQAALTTDRLSPTVRLALATGVLGGFTTYSTFNYETLQYFQRDEWLLGLANLGGTVAACLVAGVLGVLVGRLLSGS